MIVQGQVGALASTSSIASGTQSILRQGNMGDTIMSELHGRYYEACYRRALFSTANSAAVATVALGTTAYTGLSLANPVGSTVNLVLLKCSYALSVAAPTAGYLGLETGYNAGTNVTHTVAATVSNNFIGVGASGTGLADSSSTLPTAPINRLMLCNTNTVATTAYNGSAPQVVDLEGSIILPPGAYAAFYTFATNTAAWFFSFTWEEVPV
jgi:hypothetical protein